MWSSAEREWLSQQSVVIAATASDGTAAASAAAANPGEEQVRGRRPAGEEAHDPSRQLLGSILGSIRLVEEHEGVRQEVEKIPERQRCFSGVLPVDDDEVAVVGDDVPCTEIVVLHHGRIEAAARPPALSARRARPHLGTTSLRSPCSLLRRVATGDCLCEPAELEDPARDPLDQPHLVGPVARRAEDVAQPSTGRSGLERRMDFRRHRSGRPSAARAQR